MDTCSNTSSPDPGLLCLVALARFHQVAVEPAQLAHQFPAEFSVNDILRAAKSLGLKARLAKIDPEKINNALLPAIAKASDGSFFILARISGEEKKFLVHDLRKPQPETISRRTRRLSGR